MLSNLLSNFNVGICLVQTKRVNKKTQCILIMKGILFKHQVQLLLYIGFFKQNTCCMRKMFLSAQSPD